MTGEFERIEAFLRSANAGGGLSSSGAGPGDDAAVLEVPNGERLLVSTDQTAEGIHFERGWLTWEQIGYRATAAALSDMAAMAATPLACLVSIAWPPELDMGVLESLGAGVGDCLREQRAALVGGDLSASEHGVYIDVVTLGHANAPLLRSGARSGDELWLSGSIGGAGAAVASLRKGLEPDPRSRWAFERPQPRIGLARLLADRAEIHAMIDLSDGLAGDARHLGQASGVQCQISVDSLPLADELAEFTDKEVAWRLALSGGEDYELLFAAAPGTMDAVAADVWKETGIALTRIGVAGERSARGGSGSVEWLVGGETWDGPQSGFRHFDDA